MRTKIPSLIVEDYSVKKYPFLSYIEYHDAEYLIVVNNVIGKSLSALVLDLCKPCGISTDDLILACMDWHKLKSKLPVSIYLTNNGLGSEVKLISRTFKIEQIKRMIGKPICRPVIVSSSKRKRLV